MIATAQLHKCGAESLANDRNLISILGGLLSTEPVE